MPVARPQNSADVHRQIYELELLYDPPCHQPNRTEAGKQELCWDVVLSPEKFIFHRKRQLFQKLFPKHCLLLRADTKVSFSSCSAIITLHDHPSMDGTAQLFSLIKKIWSGTFFCEQVKKRSILYVSLGSALPQVLNCRTDHQTKNCLLFFIREEHIVHPLRAIRKEFPSPQQLLLTNHV